MPTPEVRIEPSQPGTLSVSGPLVFDSAAIALRTAETLLEKAPGDTLDLSEVSAADSAGLACVLAIMAAARRNGHTLRVANVPCGLTALARVCEVETLLA